MGGDAAQAPGQSGRQALTARGDQKAGEPVREGSRENGLCGGTAWRPLLEATSWPVGLPGSEEENEKRQEMRVRWERQRHTPAGLRGQRQLVACYCQDRGKLGRVSCKGTIGSNPPFIPERQFWQCCEK